MDHKELSTKSSVSTSASDGSTKFALSSPTLQANRNKSYDIGSNSLGKVDATAARPCAIIGPDRVLPPNPDDPMYSKKMPDEAWTSPENIYRRPPDYSSKVSDFQPIRNISPRQTFQENMQRIMVPPTFNSMKTSDESSLKNTKHIMPQETKYCDVPYNINSVNSDHKGVSNPDIPMSNTSSSYTRSMPPPYGWPAGVNVRPLRPYGAPEFYQYQDFPSCAGPRPMTMIRPHRTLHEENAQVYSERLYQDANIRFKPYSTGKEKHQQPRYDYINNYPSTFHPPASLPPHKYDLQKTIPGHPYPLYPQVPYKYLERRIHEPFIDGYHRSHNQQTNFNAFHNQVVPPPYGPIPGNCMQNKTYSDVSSKPINVNKLHFENNNKVYLNLEARNKNYSVPENLYYNDVANSQSMRSEILLPTHSTLNINSVPQHSFYRKDNTPLKSYDYNPNYRIFDQSLNHSLQRLPLQFSPNTLAISPDSNTSFDAAHTIGISQEDCGYVSQSSTTSTRSLDSGNIPIPHDIYRRHSYNNHEIFRNTSNSHLQIPKNKTPSNKKNLDVRQFLQMWNEGDEEASDGNKEAAPHLHSKNYTSQSKIINNQEQLYVLGLVNVPNEELGKYDHIQKISKLPENIKGYNSIEILNQYEELLETPHVSNFNKPTILRDFNCISRNLTEKEFTAKLPRPISPLDVEAKISQSVIHKEVGCNFEIKPCSPEMLNVEVAAPIQTMLGERMIEKVINPIMTQPSNLTGSNKSQNSLNDAVKVASCKMISNQYSPKNSPNTIKNTNYSVHDLESNAGLCLASLPQLDNDIELNFPEINQQFIKANQLECHIAPTLQNFPHLDLEQTHCIPQEINGDSQQHNLSPQITSGSVLDKEFSKLSKYRKGKKYELSSSHNIPKQETLKSDDSVAMLQRIDSVIIKNPDTIKIQDSVKIVSQSNHDIEMKSESPYPTVKYQNNLEKEDLSAETAIDFSLNRTEDETVVSYLNVIDKNINQHVLPLEVSNNTGNISLTSGGIKAQNAKVKFNNPPSEEVEEYSSQCSKSKVTEEHENNKQQSCKNQEVYRNNYENLITMPVISLKVSALNADQNTLVIKKLATAESLIPVIENQNCTDNTKTIPNPVCDNEMAKDSYPEEDLCNGTKDILQSEYKLDIAKLHCEVIDKSKTGNEPSGPFNSITVESAINNIDNLNEIDTREVSEMSNIISDANLETDYVNVNKIQTVENDIEVLSNENIDKGKSKNDEFKKENKETENALKLLLVSETDKKINKTVLKKIDFGITSFNNAKPQQQAKGNTVDEWESINMLKIEHMEFDVSNKDLSVEVSQQNSETNMDTSELANLSSKTEQIVVNDKNEIGLTNLVVELTEHKQEVVLYSTKAPLHNDDKVESLPDEDLLRTSSVVNDIGSLPVKTFLVTGENMTISHKDACETKSIEFESVVENETKSIINSTVKLAEFSQKMQIESTIDDSLTEYKTNVLISDVESLYDESDVHTNIEIKSCLSMKNKTSEEYSNRSIVECRQQSEINDVDAISITMNRIENLSNSHKDACETKTVESESIIENETKSIINSTIKLAEFSQEMQIESTVNDLLTECKTNILITEVERLCDETDLHANNGIKSCLSMKNNTSEEYSNISTVECRQQIERNDIDVISITKNIIENLTNSHKDECKTKSVEFENIIENETKNTTNSTVKLAEMQINSRIDDSLPECKKNIRITDVECLYNESDLHTTDKVKSCPSTKNKTSEEYSNCSTVECRQEIERNDIDVISITTSILDTDYNVNTSKLKQETKLEPFQFEYNSESSNGKRLNDDMLINKNRPNQKELFSPWIQKLLMFTEGIYESVEYKHNDNLKDYSNNINISLLVDENDLKNNKKAVLDTIDDIKYEIQLPDADKKIDLLDHMEDANAVQDNESDLFYFTMNDEKQDIILDNDSLKEKFDYKEKQNSNISSTITIADIKPRKISKRSLSESALEEYKNNDMNFLQPCKRKKGLTENQNFLESHVITDDICNIIQSNRRNSISTFYNEDNVYIVIDNDLILSDENDDSEKICYTEISDEFPNSIESTNCDIDHHTLGTKSLLDEANQFSEYSRSVQSCEEKPIEESWVDDVGCIETIFSEDVAENIVIDIQSSTNRVNSLDLESVNEESNVFYDSGHIDKIKTIYGRTMYDDNTQLIETLYRTPQMNVNKTLYHIEPQDCEGLTFDSPSANKEQFLESNEHCCTDILESGIVSNKVIIDNKENLSENVSRNVNDNNDIICKSVPNEEQDDKEIIDSYESSNDYVTSNIQKENSVYSCSSSPEVSSTTSEEKNSSILLKITNCNGSRVSQINEIRSDVCKLSYKLTEKRDYQTYSSNFSSSRTLITKAAQKYIPPLKETLYDFKIKLPLPQHRLHTLKQLKIAKLEPKIDATSNNSCVKFFKQDTPKKPKLKFEDVLKSIDEINFKKQKSKIKKGKNSIPKVVIKKNENGAHYASSKTISRNDSYNPDLTGRKWQPWVFLEKNSFIDRMALQNKVKAVYCHRKNCFILADRFRKYKSVYNANFVISQPSDTSTRGNLKYTIRLKQF